MVHRKVKKNHVELIQRNVTTHSMKGVDLTEDSALIASFSDTIRVTHKGKHLEVYLHLMMKKEGQQRNLNIKFKVNGLKVMQGEKIMIMPNIDSNYNLEMK